MKISYIGIIFIFILFLLPHTKLINRPLIGLHDMDNGHLLTTVYLWRTEGITNHHFAPIYTFSPNDINLRTWGVVGRNNRMYHASYPPLSFWLVYLTSYVPGVGLREAAAHLTSLGVFIIGLIFFFFYLKKTYNLPTAIFGAGLFSLIPSSAYFFGGLVVADIVVFAFWIPAFVFLSSYLRFRKKIFAYLFFVSLGLSVLSEWLGFLTAFVLIAYFGISLFRKKERDVHRFLFKGSLLTSLSALLITAFVYLSVATPQNLASFVKYKYLSRASIGSLEQAGGLRIGLQTWGVRVFGDYLWNEFTPLFWATLGFLFIAGLLLKIRSKKVFKDKSPDNQLSVLFFVIPPILHTVLLSQFHFIHDYSILSYLPALCVLSARAFFTLTHRIDQKINSAFPLISFTIASLFLIVFYRLSQPMYDFLFVKQTGGWMTTVNLFTAVREVTNPDDLILTNHMYMPDMWFYLRRNAIQWVAAAKDLDLYQGYYPLFPRVFYTSDYKPFVDKVCGKRVLRPVAHGWLCQIK